MKEIITRLSEEANKLGAYRFDYDTKYRSDKDQLEHQVTLYFEGYLASSGDNNFEVALSDAIKRAEKNKEEAVLKAQKLLESIR